MALYIKQNEIRESFPEYYLGNNQKFDFLYKMLDDTTFREDNCSHEENVDENKGPHWIKKKTVPDHAASLFHLLMIETEHKKTLKLLKHFIETHKENDKPFERRISSLMISLYKPFYLAAKTAGTQVFDYANYFTRNVLRLIDHPEFLFDYKKLTRALCKYKRNCKAKGVDP